MKWNIKGVIDNIQTLNAVIPSPTSIAVTSHHSCSKLVPPQVVASLIASSLMLMPLTLEQYSRVGAYCGTHFYIVFIPQTDNPQDR